MSLHGRGPVGSSPEGQGPGEPAVLTEIAAVVTWYDELRLGVSETESVEAEGTFRGKS